MDIRKRRTMDIRTLQHTFSEVVISIVAIGLVLAMVVHDLFNMHDLTPDSFSPLKIIFALGIIAAIALPLLPKSRESAIKPLRIFSQTTLFILISNSILLLLSGLVSPHFTPAGAPAGIMALLMGYGIAILTIIIIVRHATLLDRLLLLRRTRLTGKARLGIIIGFGAIVFLQYVARLSHDDMQNIIIPSIATLTLIFVGIYSKVPWVVALTRSQKWKGYGMSVGIVILDFVLIMIFSNKSGSYNSLRLFLPGLDGCVLTVLIISAVYFSRVALALMMTLPSASIIDRKVNEVHSLSNMSRIMTQINDTGRLLETSMQMVADVCKAMAVWVELYDEQGIPAIAAQYRITGEQLRALYVDGHFQVYINAQTETVYVEDMDEIPELEATYPHVQKFMRSLIIVPVMLESKRLGTMCVVHNETFAFEHEDKALLTTFADNMSIALENARLFHVSIEKERFERELMLARGIQQKLLPVHTPVLPGFSLASYASPAFEVGGDYHDFVTLANGSLCIIIGDVSGKGMSAALYMAELKGIVLAIARESHSPKNLLERINTALYGSLDRQSYITMTAVAVDTDRCELTIARAGHTPCLLRRGKEVERIIPKGFGIGLVDQTKFNAVLDQKVVPLEAGESLVLFTDGVNEAINARQEEFGLELLEETLQTEEKAEDMVGAVIRRVIDFTGEVTQHDDITLIILTCNDGASFTRERESVDHTFPIREEL